MKRFSDYIHFTAEDFAADESFQSYILRRNDTDNSFWESFIAAHPEKLPEIREASKLLSVLRFRKVNTKVAAKQVELDRLLSSLSSSKSDVKLPRQTRYTTPRKALRSLFATRLSRVTTFASAVLIAFFAGYYALDSIHSRDTITYRTQFGGHETYVLPDSSVVILNGNTTLRHKRKWDNSSPREVWLEGEAFFDVTHKHAQANARFIVHIPDMDVEVLGTKFNVFNRKDKANVVLNSGKVKVRVAFPKDTSTVFMSPDEVLELSRKDHTILKKQVNAEVITSWRNQVLILEHTPISQIAEMIEYTYGVKVTFEDGVDTTEELAGTIPSHNIDILLNVLARTSDLNITKTKNEIIISKDNMSSNQD